MGLHHRRTDADTEARVLALRDRERWDRTGSA